MLKKILVVAAVALVATVAVANRPVVLSDLESLAALNGAEHLDGTRAAMQTVNERALQYLPTAATLRTEDAIAAIALKLSEQAPTDVVAAR